MRFIGLVLAVVLSTPAWAGFRAFNGTADLRIFNSIKCSTGMTCSRVGDKLNMVAAQTAFSGSVSGGGTASFVGFLQPQVAATATTITAAQCGSTFYNTGAVVINLPNGSAGLIGCRLTFITLNASNFDINPGNADQIMLLTNAVGDAIRNATVANTVILQYAATNEWVDLGHIGTWTDIN